MAVTENYIQLWVKAMGYVLYTFNFENAENDKLPIIIACGGSNEHKGMQIMYIA